MKRKIFLILFFSLFIVACGSATDDQVEQAEDATEQSTDKTENDSGIEVDKGIFNVEVTLPPELFEDEEVSHIEAEIKEDSNAEVIQNDDGSITFKMSKKDHKKMMSEMKDGFIETIDEIVEDDEFSSIKDITYNKDFTEIKISADKEVFENSFDGIATFSLGLGSMYYQAFNGKDLEKEKVIILVEDESTNEVFNEIVYPDQFDEMDETL